MFNMFDKVRVYYGSFNSNDGFCLTNRILHPKKGYGYVVSGNKEFVKEDNINGVVKPVGSIIKLYSKLPQLKESTKEKFLDLISVDNASRLISVVCNLRLAGIDEDVVLKLINEFSCNDQISLESCLRIASVTKLIEDGNYSMLTGSCRSIVDIFAQDDDKDLCLIGKAFCLGVYPPHVLHLKELDLDTIETEVVDSLIELIKIAGISKNNFNMDLGEEAYFDELVSIVSEMDVTSLKQRFGVYEK